MSGVQVVPDCEVLALLNKANVGVINEKIMIVAGCLGCTEDSLLRLQPLGQTRPLQLQNPLVSAWLIDNNIHLACVHVNEIPTLQKVVNSIDTVSHEITVEVHEDLVGRHYPLHRAWNHTKLSAQCRVDVIAVQ